MSPLPHGNIHAVSIEPVASFLVTGVSIADHELQPSLPCSGTSTAHQVEQPGNPVGGLSLSYPCFGGN